MYINMAKRSEEPYTAFIQRVRAPQEDIDFFPAVPIARPCITSEAYRAIPFISRTKEHVFSESFFGTTINTADTIPRMLALMRNGDFERLCSSASAAAAAAAGGGESDISTEANGHENTGFIVFAQLGRGVNGFRDTLHGGVLAALLDEVFGPCAEGYRATVSGVQAQIYTDTICGDDQDLG